MALAGNYLQVLAGGYDLTGDSNRFAISDNYEAYDVTAYLDAVHKSILGRRTIALQHTGYMNAATAHAHPVLKTANIQGVLSLFLGQNAQPAVGDPVHSLFVQQGGYSALPQVGKYVPFTAAFANGANLGGWGVALAVPISFTNTTNGSAINNGAASTRGGTAFLHVLQAAASDTYTITVEGSTTGAFAGEQTTLVTFSLNGSALGSDYQALAGTVPQYTRWRAARSGSAGNTVQMAVSLVRF